MDRFIGKKLDGRYEIQELIGVGGMANVYKARDVIDGRTVAVKILRDEHLENSELLRRFKNESKAIAALSHPNIVRIYDVSLSDRVPFIVMEYIDGITLKEYIDQQKVLKWKEAVYFTVQILRALQHAHDRGIVHRDIKPHNIMLLSDGTIKVTDFGIARISRSESRTITDKAFGSVHYISPEQAQGGVTDARSDVYSVGVMLYEMTTGKLPFEADNPVSVALKQIQIEPARPREINPDIPEGLESITMKAMQKDPTLRYQSAAEMLRDIDNFKKNPSISFEYQYLSNDEEDKKKIAKSIDKVREEPEELEERPKKKAPIVSVLAGVTFAFVLATAVFVFMLFKIYDPFKATPELEMPMLVGERYDTVIKTYEGKLDIQVVSEDYSDEYAKGVIYHQDPASGRTVKEGAVVKVKVSNGPEQLVVPDIVGQDQAVGIKMLDDKGITHEEVKEFSPTVAEGYIIRTTPEVGTEIDGSTVVTVYVSLGAEKKYIPVSDYTGLPFEDVKKMLAADGLKVGPVTQQDSDLPPGTVISQDPVSPALVEEGSYVNFVISSMPDTSEVSLMVKLPDYDQQVTVQAALDGEIVQEEKLTPSEVRVWNITFQGSGAGHVIIMINGNLYQGYDIDFDEGTSTLLPDEDMSDGFQIE